MCRLVLLITVSVLILVVAVDAQSQDVFRNNPFNLTTAISYSLPVTSSVSLQLYDITGRNIQTLYKGKKEAGIHRTMLNTSDLPSGLYFIRLEAGADVVTQKVMLIR